MTNIEERLKALPHKEKRFCKECDERTRLHKLVLTNYQSPGDLVCMTAALRDLHQSFPGRYTTDVITSCDPLFQGNPFITRLTDVRGDANPHAAKARDDGCIVEDGDTAYIPMTYDILHDRHFCYGFHPNLEKRLGVRLKHGPYSGDIHLADCEKQWMSQLAEIGVDGPFWIIHAGGKFDFTDKWKNPAVLQKTVAYFGRNVQFVQVGVYDNYEPPLNGVINLTGQMDMRMLIRLLWHSEGVVTGVDGIMHLAAAVPTKSGNPRPCVVIAGAREPSQWERYPTHQYLTAYGGMACYESCRRAIVGRATLVGDGDSKDRDATCQHYVEYDAPYPAGFNGDRTEASLDDLRNGFLRRSGKPPATDRLAKVRIAKCLDMIEGKDVIRAVEMYREGRDG